MSNQFYIKEPDFQQVSRDEYNKFIENYPRPLAQDVCAICDPPIITHNDFELANRWPYSVVARTWLYGILIYISTLKAFWIFIIKVFIFIIKDIIILI